MTGIIIISIVAHALKPNNLGNLTSDNPALLIEIV